MSLLAVSSYNISEYYGVYNDQHGVSEDQARAANHLPEGFAKTKKATNILRPAIDVITLGQAEIILGRA